MQQTFSSTYRNLIQTPTMFDSQDVWTHQSLQKLHSNDTGAKLSASINSEVITLSVDIRRGRDKCANINFREEKKHPHSTHLSCYSLLLAWVFQGSFITVGPWCTVDCLSLIKGHSIATEQCTTLNNSLHQGLWCDSVSVQERGWGQHLYLTLCGCCLYSGLSSFVCAEGRR